MARRKFHRYIAPLVRVLVLTGGIAIFAQDTPTSGNPASDASTKNDTSSIQGTVVAAASGEPVRGARLTLSPIGQGKQQPEPKFGTTDGEGRFLITGVAAGRYHFLAAKNGYVKQAYRPDGTEGSETILNLAAGQKLEKVLFRLKLASVILGRITDENGEPVAGVQVEALVSQAKSAEGLQVPFLRGQLIPVKTAATNDLGEYRIYGLPPRSYYVAVNDSSFPELAEALSVAGGSTGFVVSSGTEVIAATLGDPSINHATVYYPGVAQRSRAQKIRVGAGQEMRVDLALVSQKTVAVSGYVIGSNGKPSPQTMVVLRSQNIESMISSLRTMGSTDERGHFEIKGVPPGSYFASATVAEHEGRTASAEQPLEVGSEDVTLRLHLTGGIEISGRIIVASSSKIDMVQPAITLSPSQGLEQFGFGEVKEDRTFTVSNIQSGTYGLQLSGLPEGWYVSAADFGGENVLETGLKLGDAGSHTLVVTVKFGMGKIEGTVLKGDDPVSGAAVDLIPEHPSPYRSDLARTTATDQSGHFVIPDVVPGKYRALAATREDNESDDDSDDPAASDSSGTNIEVREGESKTVQLKLRTGR